MHGLDPPRFHPHGASLFERHGQLLLLQSEGPFNAEHIQSLAPRFRELGEALQRSGPWATINIVRSNIMVTPDGMEMLRASARWTHEQLGRVAAAYVVAPEVEGRGIMLPRIRAASSDILPTELFATYAEAEAWALAQLAAAAP